MLKANGVSLFPKGHGIVKRWIVLCIALGVFMGTKSIEAQGNPNIEIVSFGPVDPAVLGYLKKNLSEIFKTQVSIGKSYGLADFAYNKDRKQYLSTAIIKNLPRPNDVTPKTLAVIDKDLYVPELHFVFGEAYLLKGTCIISVTRLRQSYYGLTDNNDLFLKRTLKEAVHEIGHLFNIGHCPNPLCVMHFSNSLPDTDRKDFHFCDNCKKLLTF